MVINMRKRIIVGVLGFIYFLMIPLGYKMILAMDVFLRNSRDTSTNLAQIYFVYILIGLICGVFIILLVMIEYYIQKNNGKSSIIVLSIQGFYLLFSMTPLFGMYIESFIPFYFFDYPNYVVLLVILMCLSTANLFFKMKDGER